MRSRMRTISVSASDCCSSVSAPANISRTLAGRSSLRLTGDLPEASGFLRTMYALLQLRRLQIRIFCGNRINDIQDCKHRVTYHFPVAADLFDGAHRLDFGQSGILFGAMSEDGIQHDSGGIS